MPMDNEFDDIVQNRDIESLTQELANRGTQLCEKQIRYDPQGARFCNEQSLSHCVVICTASS